MKFGRRALSATACVVVCGLVAGCAASTAGRAVPASSSVGSTSSAAPLVAAGPRTFNLTGVDPCALIPQGRRLEFGLNQPEMHSTSQGQPFCSLPSSIGPFAAVFFDFRKSAQETVEPVRKNVFQTVNIEGFKIPLVAVPKVSQCEGYVQTSSSQYMSVSVNGLGKIPDLELCKRVQPLLKIAINTLKALQPS